MPANTKRIAKNTIALYFRQVLIMLVGLYTSRVVLETLGIVDFGIFNLVAGIVTMFNFLLNSMAGSIQRFFSFELGQDNKDQLKNIFSLSLILMLIICLIILVLSETVGLYFVTNILSIPHERRNSAILVYHFSVFSFLFTIITSPYMAMIIARENMKIYSYVSIIEVFLRLSIVFILRFISWDKLSLYGVLTLFITITVTFIYRTICAVKYKECRFSFYWNKDLAIKILSFSGWTLFGSTAIMFKNQLVNILLNQYFSPIVVAARAIASKVDNAAVSLSNNFITAIRPQIVKNYASGDKDTALYLMFFGSKASYLLMFIFFLPLIIEMPIVLDLWLKNTPEFTILFTRLMLIDVLINHISTPIIAMIQASGKIKIYNLLVGSVIFFNVPFSWFLLNIGMPSYFVIICAIFLTNIVLIIRVLYVRKLIFFSILHYMKTVIIPIIIISILSFIIPFILYYFLNSSIIRLFLIVISSIFFVCLNSYFFALNFNERHKFNEILFSYLYSFKKRFKM